MLGNGFGQAEAKEYTSIRKRFQNRNQLTRQQLEDDMERMFHLMDKNIVAREQEINVSKKAEKKKDEQHQKAAQNLKNCLMAGISKVLNTHKNDLMSISHSIEQKVWNINFTIKNQQNKKFLNEEPKDQKKYYSLRDVNKEPEKVQSVKDALGFMKQKSGELAYDCSKIKGSFDKMTVSLKLEMESSQSFQRGMRENQKQSAQQNAEQGDVSQLFMSFAQQP